MGKLYSSVSSLILRSIVDGRIKTLSYYFLSSFSSSFTTTNIATHLKSLTHKKNSVTVKGKGKKHDGFCFDSVDDALSLFNRMIVKYPKPSIVEFSKLVAALVRMKHYYALVVSLSNQMELSGVSHDAYIFNILINCFCRLSQVDFGFSVLGKMLKLGIHATVVTFSTLINGFCTRNKIVQAVNLFDEMIRKGFQTDLIAYNTILKMGCVKPAILVELLGC
ncbi:hypothetical protein REPUB_Repub20aG0039700 [Reevesia pubescens]